VVPSRLRSLQHLAFLGYLVALVTSMSGMEIFSLLLLALHLVYWIKERRAPSWPPFTAPILCFVAVAVLSTLVGDAPWGKKLYDLSRNRFFIVYFVLFWQLSAFEDLEQQVWLRVTRVACLLVGAYGAVQHFVPLDLVRPVGKKIIRYAVDEPGRQIGPLVLGTFNHHLTFANIFVFFACLFFALGLFSKRYRLGHFALAALLAIDCLWTSSRAAWAAVPACFIFIAWAKSRKAAWVLVGITVSLAGVLVATSPGFRERVARTVSPVHEDALSMTPRLRLWRSHFEMFLEHPWLGVGFNNNERHSAEYFDRLYPDAELKFYGHAHSLWIQILASTGILGTLCFGWLWVSVFRAARLASLSYTGVSRAVCLAALAGLIAFQIQGLTQWNFGDAESLHNLLFVWALVAAHYVGVNQATKR